MKHGRRQKIAILGGGMGGLSAALGLTSRPELRERYEVSVYQDGWLLGGKGANVRNRQQNHRIEEHGLHLFMGFYENAFLQMRQVYEELGRKADAPMATFKDAFKPAGGIVVEEKTENGWEHWEYKAPLNDLEPGLGNEPPTAHEMIDLGIRYMGDYLRQLQAESRGKARRHAGVIARLLDIVGGVRSWAAIGLATTSLSAGVWSRHGVKRVLGRARPTLAPRDESPDGAIVLLLRRVWQVVEREIARDAELRRLWIVLDFQFVNLLGMLRDGLFRPGANYSALDEIDYRTWLRQHGASEITVNSSLVSAFYNLAFGNPDGAGAGVAIIGTLRMILGYRGAVLWKMQAGMGETIFSPIYELLKRRGVKFRFFHRVRNLRLSPDRRALDAVEIGVQARVKGGGEYQPLIDVDGLPCWPEAPLYQQLEDEERLRATPVPPACWQVPWADVGQVTLERGKDYDQAILAISIGAFPFITRELMDASPRWRAMVEGIGHIKTCAMQLWLEPSLPETGFPLPPPILGTYEPPFDSWADMSHVLRLERWNGAQPRTLAYLCGTIDDGKTPPREDDRERDELRTRVHAREWLSQHSSYLFPRISDAATGALDWNVLVDAEGREGVARLESQYIRVNVDPSDRYVLSVPGTTKLRLRVDESGFESLVLAGDWVRTGLDAGCIEAATMSGMQAARHICGFPEKVYGEDQLMKGPGVAPPPRYVERPNELSLRAPYMLAQARLTGLAFRADQDALRALLDRCLNGPSGGQLGYVPAAPVAMLVAMFSQQASSLDPEHKNRGRVPESDIAFWVPCWRTRNANGSRCVPKLVWFLPHVFVDNSAAMAAGREVYGFHKSLVDFEVAHGERGLERLDVRALAIDRFHDEARAADHPLLRVERTGEDARVRAASNVTGALESLGVPTALTRFFPGASGGDPPVDGHTLVFLKQIRDAANQEHACYQAVVEARASVRSLRRWGWVDGAYRATWSSHDSHPFVEELGLAANQQAAMFGAYADFDFVMHTGSVVWSAG